MPKTIYQEHGYETRDAYLRALSDEYGVELGTVLAIAEMLGPNEDFDGLVITLEDYDNYRDREGLT